MNARNKLNVAYVNGALLIAAVAGLIAESWTIFLLALVGLIVANVLGGQIRFGPKKDRK